MSFLKTKTMRGCIALSVFAFVGLASAVTAQNAISDEDYASMLEMMAPQILVQPVLPATDANLPQIGIRSCDENSLVATAALLEADIATLNDEELALMLECSEDAALSSES